MGSPRGRHTFRRACTALFAAAVIMSAIALPAAAAPPADPVPEAAPAPVEPAEPNNNERSNNEPSNNIESVIAAARSHVGVPYQVGSEGPSLFDCSGLMYRIFQETGQLDRIGGARLRAAGYMRWFMGRGRAITAEEFAERGDLVIYNNGSHIGIYLGDGRVLSAITSGVTVHSLHGITVEPTAYLKVDWTGEGGPLADPSLFEDAPEAPASLIAPVAWVPLPTTEEAANEAGRARDERVDMRTANSRTYQNRDGTLTTEFHAEPIFHQPAGSTEWKPIDLRLESDANEAGVKRVTSSPVDLALADSNADAGFLTLNALERQVSLRFATSGQTAAASVPVVSIDGRYADYFDFTGTGIGMRVFPTADGFKSFLVMRREPNANRFSFAIDAPGMTLAAEEDGSISMRDEAGTVVGRLPRPLLLDSSDVDGNGGGVFTAATALTLATDGPLPVITVGVERRHLDEAVYPAFVDLSLTNFPASTAGADLTFASSRHANANFERYQRPEGAAYGELWHGRQPGSRTDNEIYVRFPGLAETLGTVDVAEAAFELFPYWQREEAAAPTVVHRVAAEWDSELLTWNSRPEAGDEVISTTSDTGSWSNIDVSTYVADLVAGSDDFGLVLAGDDSGATTWKRFVASGAAEELNLGPRLSITWSGLRPTGIGPSGLTTSAHVTWSHAGLATAQRRFQVEISRDEFASTVVESGTIKGHTGKLSSWATPDGSLTQGAQYSWRVRVMYESDSEWSEWSTPKTFTFGELVPKSF